MSAPWTDIDALIFDLDGILVDSEPLHQIAFQRLMSELGYDPSTAGDWHRFVGTTDRHVLEELLAGRSAARTVEAMLDRKAALYLELLREKEPVYPEIPALVEALARRYPLAVASGSLRSAVDGALELKGLKRYFRATASVQDVARGKPAPDLYLYAAALLGVEPRRCVAIEDSVAGVTAALAAGLRVIAIPNTTPAERLRAAHATAVVEGYDEVRQCILPDGNASVLKSRS